MTAREACDTIVLIIVGFAIGLAMFATGVGLWLIFATAVFARDNGQYAQVDPAIREWFGGLQSKQGGLCCSFADGFSIDDPDWETKGDQYRVRIKGEWIDVPPEAVVTSPNRIGRAIVWPLESRGKTYIRCFMPGVEG